MRVGKPRALFADFSGKDPTIAAVDEAAKARRLFPIGRRRVKQGGRVEQDGRVKSPEESAPDNWVRRAGDDRRVELEMRSAQGRSASWGGCGGQGRRIWVWLPAQRGRRNRLRADERRGLTGGLNPAGARGVVNHFDRRLLGQGMIVMMMMLLLLLMEKRRLLLLLLFLTEHCCPRRS